jgi:hypothetical protein
MKISRFKEWWFRKFYSWGFGKKEYCKKCLPMKGKYPYWLINNKLAKLVPVDDPLHKH